MPKDMIPKGDYAEDAGPEEIATALSRPLPRQQLVSTTAMEGQTRVCDPTHGRRLRRQVNNSQPLSQELCCPATAHQRPLVLENGDVCYSVYDLPLSAKSSMSLGGGTCSFEMEARNDGSFFVPAHGTGVSGDSL
jgi:hypothetical protein